MAGRPSPDGSTRGRPRLVGTHAGRALEMTALACAVALVGCATDDDPSGPEPVASVEITSPIEDVMAVARTVQLSAVARDASGSATSGAMFTWRSSDETVATVNDAGVVRGLARGDATVTATADGVSGSLDMRVVAAELDDISILLEDAYTAALVSNLTDVPGERVQTALDACADAVDAGHILDLRDCLDQIRTETATDPTDGPLLALLGVIAERAQMFLNL